jgi:hypothetical protein
MLHELRDLARLAGSARAHVDAVRSIVMGLLAGLTLVLAASVFLFALGILRWAAEFGAFGWIAVLVVLALSGAVGVCVWGYASGRLRRPSAKPSPGSKSGESVSHDVPRQVLSSPPAVPSDPATDRHRNRVPIETAIMEGQIGEAERLIAEFEKAGGDPSYARRARRRLEIEGRHRRPR